jgi:hypothetical protein
MKNLFFIALIFLAFQLSAQTNPPSGINFQAVALNEAGVEIAGVDANGVPIPDKAIKVRFSIITDDPGGAVQYSEEHLTNTDRHGLFTLTIGAGTATVGKSIKDVNWHKGTKYLKVELDINNGKGYRVVSTQQLLTVPYSLYSGESLEAKKVDTARMRDSVLLTGKIQKVQSNLDKHIEADQDTVPTNELQQMTIKGGKVSLSRGGGTIVLPDSISTNELQALSIKGGIVSLSQGGGTVKLPDSSAVNEIQTLSIAGNKLSISGNGGNTVTLPSAGIDGDTTYWKVRGTKLYYNAGKIGVGTTDPNLPFSALTVQGGTTIASDSAHAHFLNKNFTLGSPTLKLYTSANNSSAFYGINAERAYLGGDGKLVLNQYGGNVGVGNVDPQRALHINDVMRLQPRNSAPASPAKGDIYFDNTINKLRVFDGAIWQNCW